MYSKVSLVSIYLALLERLIPIGLDERNILEQLCSVYTHFQYNAELGNNKKQLSNAIVLHLVIKLFG